MQGLIADTKMHRYNTGWERGWARPSASVVFTVLLHLGLEESSEQVSTLSQKYRSLLSLRKIKSLIAASGLSQQSGWTWRRQVVERKILWTTSGPSPSRLHCWGFNETPASSLLLVNRDLEHTLSCWSKALGEGWYCWWYSHILETITESICNAITSSWRWKSSKQTIRAGEKPRITHKSSLGLLNTAQNWQLTVDLGGKFKFPQHVTETTLSPDIVLVSETAKNVVMLELTVSWEDHMPSSRRSTRVWSLTATKKAGRQDACLWR